MGWDGRAGLGREKGRRDQAKQNNRREVGALVLNQMRVLISALFL